VTLLELPRRRAEPRVFVDPPPDLPRRIERALAAIGDLPAELESLPGLDELSACLITIADELDGDPDLEDGHDRESDPAEWGVADTGGLLEQLGSEGGGEFEGSGCSDTGPVRPP